ncbi:hypothetical protein BN1723_002524, partial [Verticillium longisporum]
MSTPRTKRQFAGAASDPAQRQITSFFTPSTSPPPSSQPAAVTLPASVQTNLLSVGMRVRKSVPEGYKTGSYSAFKLWSDPSVAPTTKAKPTFKAPAQRELLPFCGIHNIGGLASQPVDCIDDDGEDDSDVPDIDDVPGLTSSQESVESVVSASSRKRIYDDDEEEAATDSLQVPYSGKSAWADGDVSPRSLSPAGWANARPMAMPRRLGQRKAATTTMTTSSRQENFRDFEEADFLVEEGMDMTDA